MRGTGLRTVVATMGILQFAYVANAAINVSVSVNTCDQGSDTCPAPQGVFFDATGTTCTAGECADSFRELHYEWNFGDSGSGTWSTSGLSKNEAFGPMAAHVYETSGTFTVNLTVTDGSVSGTFNDDIEIDSADSTFSGTTRCISIASARSRNPSRRNRS